MNRYLTFGLRHPYLLAAVMVVLFLPWAWMGWLVPTWALLVAVSLVPVAALVALALVVKDFAEESEGAGA